MTALTTVVRETETDGLIPEKPAPLVAVLRFSGGFVAATVRYRNENSKKQAINDGDSSPSGARYHCSRRRAGRLRYAAPAGLCRPPCPEPVIRKTAHPIPPHRQPGAGGPRRKSAASARRPPALRPLAALPAASAEDLALFRTAVRDVTPLVCEHVHFEPTPPRPVARQRQRDEAAALAESIHPPLLDLHLEGGDEAAWRRSGISQSTLRDLRRGRWVVQAQIDLHGMTRVEAREALVDFLVHCRGSGRRCVRVVHGKGLGSPGQEPVLKKLVHGWLAQRREVLAFCQARPADGGAGAVIVLLQAG